MGDFWKRTCSVNPNPNNNPNWCSPKYPSHKSIPWLKYWVNLHIIKSRPQKAWKNRSFNITVFQSGIGMSYIVDIISTVEWFYKCLRVLLCSWDLGLLAVWWVSPCNGRRFFLLNWTLPEPPLAKARGGVKPSSTGFNM